MKARPIEAYTEDMGPVLWWVFPITEPPYCGGPNDCGHTVEIHTATPHMLPFRKQDDTVTRVFVGGWPGYHTHFTPIEMPETPKEGDLPETCPECGDRLSTHGGKCTGCGAIVI